MTAITFFRFSLSSNPRTPRALCPFRCRPLAYCVIRLFKSEDPRWWLAVGAAVALGMMSKYSMLFLIFGVIGGLLLTPARRYFLSPWFCYGTALALLIMLPNILWQIRHHFVTLAYLKSIHARDISWGWTDDFLLNQLWKGANPVAVPIWGTGLWYLFAAPAGKRYRAIGWMYVIPLLILLLARGRDYYLAPAYPMLLAAGAVWGEQWILSLSPGWAGTVRGITWRSLVISGLCCISLTLPIAPLSSAWWRFANNSNGVFGEAGAVNLYGPAHGLLQAISGMNSNYYRGYGDPPPEPVIIIGWRRDFVDRNFESCTLARHLTNRYGIANSSVARWNEIFVCAHPPPVLAGILETFSTLRLNSVAALRGYCLTSVGVPIFTVLP